jgi:hypothetical protein
MAMTDLEMIPLKLTGDSLHRPTAGHSMQRGSLSASRQNAVV